jgi:hypothetical protein
MHNQLEYKCGALASVEVARPGRQWGVITFTSPVIAINFCMDVTANIRILYSSRGNSELGNGSRILHILLAKLYMEFLSEIHSFPYTAFGNIFFHFLPKVQHRNHYKPSSAFKPRSKDIAYSLARTASALLTVTSRPGSFSA